jgi:uncharacterized protein (DUF2126 family)
MPETYKGAARATLADLQRSNDVQPQFFSDPAVDKLLSMVTALTLEVSVLRERLDTHERLLAEKDVLSSETVDAYDPPPPVESARAKVREALIARVYKSLTDELQALAQREKKTNAIISEIQGEKV